MAGKSDNDLKLIPTKVDEKNDGSNDTYDDYEDDYDGDDGKRGILYFFVPGLMGSQLELISKNNKKKIIYPTPVVTLLNPSKRKDFFKKYMLNTELPIYGTKILESFMGYDIYGNFIKKLKKKAKSIGKNSKVILFPYDWRKNINFNVSELHECIGHWSSRILFRDCDIVLIGHSLGGVLLRILIETYDLAKKSLYYSRVSKVVLCATPLFGQRNYFHMFYNIVHANNPHDKDRNSLYFRSNVLLNNQEQLELFSNFWHSLFILCRKENLLDFRLTLYNNPQKYNVRCLSIENDSKIIESLAQINKPSTIKYIIVYNTKFEINQVDLFLPRIFGSDGILSYINSDIVKISNVYNATEIRDYTSVSHSRLLSDKHIVKKIMDNI
ncbi:MAG: putative lecithin:cholesterol acyltransferase lcat [Cotesia congregata filamentous virus 2]